MRSLFSSLSLAALASAVAFAADAPPPPPIVLAQGDAYRLSTSAQHGYLAVDLRDAAGKWIPLARKGGDRGWYGYNTKGGIVGTQGVAPHIVRHDVKGQPVVTVTCPLAAGVTHRADYFARSGFCLVVSEFLAAKGPDDAGILRLAPLFDMDISALWCYAGRNARGVLHTGTIASAVPRPGYFGVSPWGPEPGVRMAGLDPKLPYLAFFNPDGGPLVAFVYLRPDLFWRGAHHFLQIWQGASNYLYTGFFDRPHFNMPGAFLICARADGDLNAFEAGLPKMIDEATKLALASGRLPSLQAEVEARSRLASLAQTPPPAPAEATWLEAWRSRYAYTRATDALAHADGPGAVRLMSILR